MPDADDAYAVCHKECLDSAAKDIQRDIKKHVLPWFKTVGAAHSKRKRAKVRRKARKKR